MAMICVDGCRECTGCMKCQAEPELIGICEECGAEIYSGDDYYDIEGNLIHEDCLTGWAERFRVVNL